MFIILMVALVALGGANGVSVDKELIGDQTTKQLLDLYRKDNFNDTQCELWRNQFEGRSVALYPHFHLFMDVCDYFHLLRLTGQDFSLAPDSVLGLTPLSKHLTINHQIDPSMVKGDVKLSDVPITKEGVQGIINTDDKNIKCMAQLLVDSKQIRLSAPIVERTSNVHPLDQWLDMMDNFIQCTGINCGTKLATVMRRIFRAKIDLVTMRHSKQTIETGKFNISKRLGKFLERHQQLFENVGNFD